MLSKAIEKKTRLVVSKGIPQKKPSRLHVVRTPDEAKVVGWNPHTDPRKWRRKNCFDSAVKFFNFVMFKEGHIIGEYVGTDVKVKVRCKEGHEWPAKPSNCISQAAWCPICAGLSPETAKANFEQIVREKGGTLLDPYINARIHVRIQCEKQHVWPVAPSHITNSGSWCPVCMEKSTEAAKANFERIVAEKRGKILQPYVRNNVKIAVCCEKGISGQ